MRREDGGKLVFGADVLALYLVAAEESLAAGDLNEEGVRNLMAFKWLRPPALQARISIVLKEFRAEAQSNANTIAGGADRAAAREKGNAPKKAKADKSMEASLQMLS